VIDSSGLLISCARLTAISPRSQAAAHDACGGCRARSRSSDFLAVVVVDERAGDHDRDDLAGLVAELGFEAAMLPLSADARIAFITRRASSIDV